MTELDWGDGRRSHDRGTDQGVVYFLDGTAQPWVGLIGVSGDPETDTTDVFFEGEYVANSRTHEVYTAEVECFTYPPDILRKPAAAFSYRTLSGEGFKVHLVYNPKFHLPSRSYSTYDDSAEPSMFNVEVRSVPEKIEGYAPSSYLVIDTTNDDGSGNLQVILDELYGSSLKAPKYLPPGLLVGMSKDKTYLNIVILDLGGGLISWEGDDVSVSETDNTFSVDHNRITQLGTEEFSSEVF